MGGIEEVQAPRKDLPPGTPTSTSSFDVSRIPDDLGLAVVELGTNDAGDDVSPEIFAKQYSLILDRIRTTSPNSYLVCLSPWQPAAAYTTIIVSACTTRPRASYVDISRFFDAPGMRGPAGQTTPFGISDDFHPNDAGHRAIADAVLQALW
jgi:lysophospholipase L1-like esterase